MTKPMKRIEIADREILIVGTAHISKTSVEEVSQLIETEKPERVCVEIDEARYRSISGNSDWNKLDIMKIIKEGKGFLLLANLSLSSFQRRLGSQVDVKPGEEMIAAIDTASKLGIPFSLCDRDVQVTLRRAWGKCNFWNKSKLLASMLSASLTNEKLSSEDIEKLKNTNELDDMMRELAEYLPKVKEVLIDERDRYLASNIWQCKEKKIIAIVGAGHVEGITEWLKRFEEGESTDISSLNIIPEPSLLTKILKWIIPLIIVALLSIGFFRSSTDIALGKVLTWMLLNGSLAALGAILCLAHPLSILAAFFGAPIATLNPFIGVGLFSGLVEAFVKKPQVSDFESLNKDINSLKGFYKNRITHILLVSFLSTLGGAIGNFISLSFLVQNAL